MWQEAFGDQVNANITPIEQGQYIGLALSGDFDVFAWRNHGGTDPDQQLLWWISAASAPIGGQALNFGRFSDEVIDENLDHHPHQPRRGGPHRGGRGDQRALRRAGLQPVAGLDDLGHLVGRRTSTTRCATPCPTAPRDRARLRRSPPAQPDLV